MKDKLSMEQAEELRRALDLTQVPDAVNRKLRQVYAELPEEVPHKSRWREPLLKAAGVFAALAVVCGGLLGLNAANPALAESIPGLGSLFALMNDHTMHPMGSHVGTYEGSVEELDRPRRCRLRNGARGASGGAEGGGRVCKVAGWGHKTPAKQKAGGGTT